MFSTGWLSIWLHRPVWVPVWVFGCVLSLLLLAIVLFYSCLLQQSGGHQPCAALQILPSTHQKLTIHKTITTDCHSLHFSSKSRQTFFQFSVRSHQGNAITFPRRPQTEWKSDVNKRSQSRADSSLPSHNIGR